MKKILLFVICLFSFSLVIGCNTETKDLKKFFDKLNSEGASYQMDIVIDMPIIPDISYVFKVDGNVMYQPSIAGSGEMYYEIDDDKIYLYHQILGIWVKNDFNEEFPAPDTQDFKAEDFEYKDGIYTLKEDKLEEYEAVSLKIELNEDLSSGVFTITAINDGITVAITMTISKFGEIELTLPEVN